MNIKYKIKICQDKVDKFNWDDIKFIKSNNDLFEHLSCPICRSVMKNAVYVSCCSVHFCSNCINDWAKESNSSECPHCRENYNDIKSAPLINSMIDKAKVSCSSNLCDYVDTLDNFMSHWKTCKYILRVCKFPNCPEKIAEIDRKLHERKCKYKVYICSLCNIDLNLHDKKEHALYFEAI